MILYIINQESLFIYILIFKFVILNRIEKNLFYLLKIDIENIISENNV